MLLRIPVGGPDPRLTATLVRGAGAGTGHLLLCIHGGGCNGRYFDLPGFSLAEAAVHRGFAVVLLDRPGFGRSAPPCSVRPIAEAASLLPDFVEHIVSRYLASTDRISVVAHSIGGAVALRWAASGQTRLAGLALSGISGELSAEGQRWWQTVRHLPEPGLPTDFFFGPEGSYDWRGPAALRKAAEPWRFDEVRELFDDWPGAFGAVAENVRGALHWRLADHERIWAGDAAALDRFATAMANCCRLDCGIASGGGHLMEVHEGGAALIAEQLAFLETVGDRGIKHAVTRRAGAMGR